MVRYIVNKHSDNVHVYQNEHWLIEIEKSHKQTKIEIILSSAEKNVKVVRIRCCATVAELGPARERQMMG